MMDIPFREDEQKLKEMMVQFNNIPDAIYLDHYQLSSITTFSSLEWKNFITHPLVADWLQSEMVLLAQAKYRLLIKDIDSNSRSTGLPQLINALGNQIDGQSKKSEGPIFIVLHTPLNDEEKHAPNVKRLTPDLQLKDLTEV